MGRQMATDSQMTDTALSGQPAPGAPRFTYSHPGQSRFRRNLIRAVERLSGRARLHRMYCEWQATGQKPDETVFDAALRLLDVQLQIEGQAQLAALPGQGGLLMVANHPFGILDGLAIGQIGMRLRGNARILTNSQLCQVPEIAPYLLPVDFSGGAEARRLTSATRRRAVELLSDGKVVAIFPAGGVATANSPVKGRALDAEWHPFVGRLATIPGVTTLPLHFSGQNSRLFQIASHLSYPLRVALIFHETRRRIGQPLRLTIGTPVSAQELGQLDRASTAGYLRRRTMLLSDKSNVDPDEVFVWPRHVKW